MLEAALRLWGDRLVAKLQVRDWKSSEPIPLEELRAYYDLISRQLGGLLRGGGSEDLDLISKIITR